MSTATKLALTRAGRAASVPTLIEVPGGAVRDELTVTVVGVRGERTDLTVSCARGAAVGDVLAVLRQAAGPVAGPLLLEGRQLDPAAPWASCGVRHGSVLTPAPTPVVGDGRFELRVVSGPSAGRVHRFGAARLVVGRDPGCDVVLHDDEASRRHVEIWPDRSGGLLVRDLGSTNGAAVDDSLVSADGCPLPLGALLTVGESQLVALPARTDRAALDRGPGPSLRLLRPPRVTVRPAELTEVAMPAAPVAGERSRIPWTALAVPAALGAVMFAVLPSSPQFLLLMAMSPLMMLGNVVSERLGGKRGQRAAQRSYQTALAGARASAAAARTDDERRRRDLAPDPAELLGRATLPSSRLWERRGDDPDALALRLGVADLPARVVPRPAPAAEGDGNAAAPARSVPVVLSLDEVPVLGVVGDAPQSVALTRWLVGQAAVLLAPSDLTIVVLTTEAAQWTWLRWLPHAQAVAGADCQAMVGLDPGGWARRAAEVSRLLDSAVEGRVLLVLDGVRQLRQVPGVAALLAEGPGKGLRVVCRDREERLLPQECTAVAAFVDGSRSRLRLRRGDGTVVEEVLADQVDVHWAETVGRGIAGLEDGGDRSLTAGLPGSVRLLDLVGLPVPTAEAVAERWAQVGSTTSVPVGVGDDGTVCLDLSADGPHALVAGTTGAGKSELLQTLVASLALANRPDALTFVLVDYKGGAAFRDCARLPHTVGLVTDLDGRLTERALASLSAELRRRERVLAEHGAKDLEALILLTRHDPAPPLARLVIVIDEFATLVEELPEFVRGLVGIAQRGRSLGIHLVLATQRPGGVVSPDIRANTNLRICLRVTHAGESSDVVDSPGAAAIAAGLAGRGLLRTGAGALRAFQAARVGGQAPVTDIGEAPPSVLATPFDGLAERPARPREPAFEDGPTDLSLLVDAAGVAFASSGLPSPRRPWLDPLPEVVVLDDLPAGPDELPLGVVDLPAEQARLPYALRLSEPGHLLIAGTPRSGRSTVLQTLAGGIARCWSPDDVHVYALDFGNQGLAPLEGLPHCGAVVGPDQGERLDRLLSRLTAEVGRRQALLSAGGYADLGEQRRLAPQHERLPWLLLLLDRWEAFLEVHQDVELGRRVDELLRLLREGPSAGLRAVLTADRSGLVGRLPSVIRERVVLRLADRGDYALADIPAREAPTAPPPGRGLVAGKGQARTFHEVQIALLTGNPAGPAQLAALRDLVSLAQARQSGQPLRHPPLRVDPLPATVSVDEVLRLGPTADEAAGLWALIGVGGDQLAPVGVDLREHGPGFLVVGAPRSGRSTALLTMAESLLRSGRPVCLVTPRRSPLAALARHPGVTGCLDAASSEDDARRALLATGASSAGVVVVVDDAEWLTDTAVGLVLENELRAEPGQGAYVVAAGNNEDLQSTYRGFTVGLRRSRCGLLLNPQTSLDGDLVGARLPRQLSAARHAGRALLAVRGELTPVQVARA